MADTSVALRTEDPEQIETEAGRRSKVTEVPEGAEWNLVEQVMRVLDATEVLIHAIDGRH